MLVSALLVITLLSMLLASTLLISQNKYHAVVQAASWQQAIGGAEAGVELAMAALNSNDWSAWKTAVGSAPPRTPPPAGAPALAASGPPSPGAYNYQSVSLARDGAGSDPSSIFVTVDAPRSLSNAPGGQWMRIRAAGITELAGPAQISMEPKDNALRRLSFVTDRDTGKTLSRPRATRAVEAIARPNHERHAIILQERITMDGGVIDSFDSSDPRKSTLSLYDPLKRQSHGDVAMADSTSSDLGDMPVYGNVYYNGPVPANSGGVKGALNPNFSTTFAPVTAPDPAVWKPTNRALTLLRGSAVLTAGTKANPARYKFSELTIGLGQILMINPPLGGGESYIEIWVTGSLTTSGTGIVIQLPGVHATYFVEGDILMSGGSFINKSNVAANLQINGVDPGAGETRRMAVSGLGNFVGVINAPSFNFTIADGGDYSGALIGRTFDISGRAGIHYDEALNKTQTGYRVASWYEDLR